MFLLLSAHAATISVQTPCFGDIEVDTSTLTWVSGQPGEPDAVYTFPAIDAGGGYTFDTLRIWAFAPGGGNGPESGIWITGVGPSGPAIINLESNDQALIPSHSVHALPSYTLADFDGAYCTEDDGDEIVVDGVVTSAAITRDSGGQLTIQSECFGDILLDTTTMVLSSSDPDIYTIPRIQTDDLFSFDRVYIDQGDNTLDLVAEGGGEGAGLYIHAASPGLFAGPELPPLPADLSIADFSIAECNIESGFVPVGSETPYPDTLDGFVTAVSYTPYVVDVSTQSSQVVSDLGSSYTGPTGDDLPTADEIQSDLQAIVDLLDLGTCEVGATRAEHHVAGEYNARSRVISGVDSLGVSGMNGTVNTRARRFSVMLSDGTQIDGTFDKRGKWLGDGPSTQYAAGHWKRIAGFRGVFYGVTGECDGGGTASEALADW